ncbi:MAG: hypothetical protein JWO38_4495 [Gemmataceae bacterium]|nr:hypothetical protein [Gemmataceae bacterium]
MTRLPACAILAAAAFVVMAQPPAPPNVEPAKAAPPAANPPASQAHIITLIVSPAAAPTPALKFELLPRLRDRTPGNAALDYHRAYILRPTWPRDPAESRKQDEMVSKWEDSPVDQLPVAEVKKFLAGYAGTFKSLDQGSRCDRCDWELIRKLHTDSIGMLLPEIQANRELARFQKLRIRADLAGNDFAAASRDLQTGFRLAKDVGEGPTLIQMLVGLAIAAVFTGEVDQFVQRPDAPNLYWALATLPRPFVDPRPGLEGEAMLFETLFPNAKEFEKGPVSTDRANQMLEDTLGAFRRTAGGEGMPSGFESVAGKLGLTAYVALHYPDAKKQLIALGRPAAEVDKMPPAQVVALRSVTLIRALTDDQAKCFSLPYPQARAELARVQARTATVVKENQTDVLIQLFSLTLPAMEKVYQAHTRTDRRLAGLRAVEAVRMYAAANNGQIPKQLADVTLVPVPDDPNTGKPFEYAADGKTFTLTAPATAGEQANSSNSFRYVVTIRK